MAFERQTLAEAGQLLSQHGKSARAVAEVHLRSAENAGEAGKAEYWRSVVHTLDLLSNPPEHYCPL